MSKTGDPLPEPIGSLLSTDATEIPYPRNLEGKDAVVVIENASTIEDGDNLAGLPRCLDYPDGLKRPAIVYGALEHLVKVLPLRELRKHLAVWSENETPEKIMQEFETV